MLIRYGRQRVRVSTDGKFRDFSPQHAALLCKSPPWHTCVGTEGKWRYSFNTFTISAVQGSERLTSLPGHFTPDGVKWPGRLCGTRGCSERARKISPAEWLPRVISSGSERHGCETDHLSSQVRRLRMGRVTSNSALCIYSMVHY